MNDTLRKKFVDVLGWFCNCKHSNVSHLDYKECSQCECKSYKRISPLELCVLIEDAERVYNCLEGVLS